MNIQTSKPPLLLKTFKMFDLEGIKYCHWKSSASLDNSFRSNTDFDLLISVEDSLLLQKVLNTLGFKRKYFTQNYVYPGMEDYLGFDEQTGMLFHFHIHYRLVIGRKHQKNYLIPIEQLILDTSIYHETLPIKIIIPELELFLLVIRLFLKLNIDKRTLRNIIVSRYFIPRKFLTEYAYLIKQINKEHFINYAYSILPESIELITPFVNKAPNDFSIIQLFIIRAKLKKILKPYKIFDGMQHLFEKIIRKLSVFNQRSWLNTGGKTIAFIGVDGAGKSSTIKLLTAWLGSNLSVQIFYMGLPKFKTRWYILNKFTRFFKKLHLNIFAYFLRDLSYLYAAYYKKRTFLKAQKTVAQGIIVFFDRFPTNVIGKDLKYLDGPQNFKSSFFNKIQSNFFSMIHQPDSSIVLTVELENALKRKPNKNSDFYKRRLNKKIHEIKTLNKIDSRTITFICTDNSSQAEVVAKLKKIIWRLI